MEQDAGIELLKENFKKVEEKFDDFFKKGIPRWPGEQQDFLRNHHKNLNTLFVKNITFERLGITDLPDEIISELKLAFEAFREGRKHP